MAIPLQMELSSLNSWSLQQGAPEATDTPKNAF
jgi:hypothetical protein